MTDAAITEVRTRLLRIPLTRPWGADVREVSVIEVAVRDSDGGEGVGFSWTPTIGSRAVSALLEDDIAPFALGRPAQPSIWQSVWERLHEAGGGGITTIALAGLDLALWDLAGRRQHRSVTDLLDRRH